MSDVLTRDSAESTPARLPAEPGCPPAGSEERLDWDVALVTPPARPHGTIRVTLEYKGRSKPIPTDDPWAE